MSIAVPLHGFGASGGSPNKSTIIVTAPTGSTVTCKMGSTTKTATEKNGVWTFGGLDLGTWTITSKKGGDSATQDVAITRLTVEYVTIVYRITPEFTYTGDYEIVDDSDNLISNFANWKNNWKIRFLTSGAFTVTKLNGWNGLLDVFLVGGGGGSKGGTTGTGGGGGGYTTTANAVSVVAGTAYDIVVGAGGSAANGGNTSAFSVTASGGSCNNGANGGTGGSGGGAYQHAQATGECAGGSDGGNGGDSGYGANGGTGQGTTTREFGDSSSKLYAGGGGGSSGKGTNNPVGGAGGGGTGGRYSDGSGGTNGETNTGGGAGGAGINSTMSGGSGIVIIRNARGAA